MREISLPESGGNATVPDGVFIGPPQAFVDAMARGALGSSIFSSGTIDFSGLGATRLDLGGLAGIFDAVRVVIGSMSLIASDNALPTAGVDAVIAFCANYAAAHGSGTLFLLQLHGPGMAQPTMGVAQVGGDAYVVNGSSNGRSVYANTNQGTLLSYSGTQWEFHAEGGDLVTSADPGDEAAPWDALWESLNVYESSLDLIQLYNAGCSVSFQYRGSYLEYDP